MASFKRIKLFSNKTSLTSDNVIYDEVWAYKLLTDRGASRKKYRIRYQRTDNPMAFGMSEEEAEAISTMLDHLGPAVSCTLDIWDSKIGWIKCLDWMGNPSATMFEACSEINDQFKSFITGVAIPSTVNDYIPTPSSPINTGYGDFEDFKPSIEKPDKSEKKPKDDTDPPDFDWI